MFNSKETLLIMALPSESQGLFEKAGVPVYFCGIGKINAAYKTTELILTYKPKRVLNLGTAGSHFFKTHEVIECSSYIQKDMDLSPLGFPKGQTPLDDIPGMIEFPTVTSLTKGVLGTGDVFELGLPQLKCDLVDMEGYAIAKVCKRLKVDFTAIKYITDGSDPQAKEDWLKNLAPASKKLFSIYKELIDTPS